MLIDEGNLSEALKLLVEKKKKTEYETEVYANIIKVHK